MSTKSAKSDEIHEISANNHASSIEVDEPMISEEIQYEDERVDVSQNNAEHPVTGLKENIKIYDLFQPNKCIWYLFKVIIDKAD